MDAGPQRLYSVIEIQIDSDMHASTQHQVHTHTHTHTQREKDTHTHTRALETLKMNFTNSSQVEDGLSTFLPVTSSSWCALKKKKKPLNWSDAIQNV